MRFDIVKKILLITLSLFLLTKDVYALGYTGTRDSRYSSHEPSTCDTGGFGTFDVLGSSNQEMEWVVTNPSCYGFIASLGAIILVGGRLVSHMCIPTQGLAVASPYTQYPTNGLFQPVAVLGISTGMKVAAAFSDCARKSALTGASSGAMAAACAPPHGASALCVQATAYNTAAISDQSTCCTAVASWWISVAAGVAYLGGLFETAAQTYEHARVCGHNWFSWQEFDVDGLPVSATSPAANRGYWKRGAYPNSRSKEVRDLFLTTTSTTDVDSPSYRGFSNKNYREFFYNGAEFEDRSGTCRPPSNWSEADQRRILGYVSSNQRYYMRGPGVSSHYACYRYLTGGTIGSNPHEKAAYDCCVARSQNTMCIENKTNLGELAHRGHQAKFCAVGDQCMISAVGFAPEPSTSQINTICAQTKTLCPYDHVLGGGTEEKSYRTGRTGDVISPHISNYCQFNKHCVKVPARPYVRINDYDSAFISSACKNFVGHSQNVYNSTNEVLPMSNIKNFSAPIVECMSETIQNMIQNRAGYTQCSSPDEVPRRVGSQYICENGYDFREGDELTTPSPFEKLQDLLRSAVKLVLVLSVVMLGYTTLLALKPLDRKTIIVYVMKFAFVVYFALGTGWQDLFIDNVFKISSNLASIVTKFEDSPTSYAGVSDSVRQAQQAKLDGCQFPKFDASKTRNATVYPNPSDDPYYAVNNPGDRRYSPGYEYLKSWDTLDCKFVRALGFGPDMTVPNLILTILAGLLTGGLGIIFVMFTLIFAFFYISMILRALHIFLISTISIALLVFISPITITAILFKKTKDIFDRWLKQLLGFIIQPAILFAYISIFVAVMDYSVYGIRHDLPDNGGLTFSGDGLDQPKGTVCNGDANNNSLFCIFGFSQFGSYSGMEPIGIILPFLVNMNKEKLDAIIRAGLLMFIFANFMDKISDLAGELTGSKGIKSKTPHAAKIAGKSFGIARGVQKRGTRVAGKAIVGGAKKTGRAAAATANLAFNRGKKPDDSDKNDK